MRYYELNVPGGEIRQRFQIERLRQYCYTETGISFIIAKVQIDVCYTHRYMYFQL